jgi:hypothetical protein
VVQVECSFEATTGEQLRVPAFRRTFQANVPFFRRHAGHGVSHHDILAFPLMGGHFTLSDVLFFVHRRWRAITGTFRAAGYSFILLALTEGYKRGD